MNTWLPKDDHAVVSHLTKTPVVVQSTKLDVSAGLQYKQEFQEVCHNATKVMTLLKKS